MPENRALPVPPVDHDEGKLIRYAGNHGDVRDIDTFRADAVEREATDLVTAYLPHIFHAEPEPRTDDHRARRLTTAGALEAQDRALRVALRIVWNDAEVVHGVQPEAHDVEGRIARYRDAEPHDRTPSGNRVSSAAPRLPPRRASAAPSPTRPCASSAPSGTRETSATPRRRRPRTSTTTHPSRLS